MGNGYVVGIRQRSASTVHRDMQQDKLSGIKSIHHQKVGHKNPTKNWIVVEDLCHVSGVSPIVLVSHTTVVYCPIMATQQDTT